MLIPCHNICDVIPAAEEAHHVPLASLDGLHQVMKERDPEEPHALHLRLRTKQGFNIDLYNMF